MSTKTELARAQQIIIEADALSTVDGKPRSYQEAAISIVAMMSHGVSALYEVEKLRAEIAEYENRQPCGHANRHILHSGEGTHFCLVCVLEKQGGAELPFTDPAPVGEAEERERYARRNEPLA